MENYICSIELSRFVRLYTGKIRIQKFNQTFLRNPVFLTDFDRLNDSELEIYIDGVSANLKDFLQILGEKNVIIVV